MQTSNEVAIRVLHKQRGTDSVWSLDTLAEKVLIMRDMYERMEEGGSLVVSSSCTMYVYTSLVFHFLYSEPVRTQGTCIW